jgi:pimeloyl-ACP methyl ester carboxylesterase
MPFISSQRHRIFYEVSGPDSAPPLLLIMGLGFSSRAWDELPPRLAEHFRVITFDNCGTGRSPRPRGPFGIAHLADDAAAVLDAVSAPDAHVFGISMGGMIALELALRHPGRVRSLALGATYAGWLRSAKPSVDVVAGLLAGIATSGRRRDPSAAARLASILVSADHLARDLAGYTRWMARVEHASTAVAALQLLAVARHDTEARIGRIGSPTLVITGDADRLVPAENSRRLARMIPGARLVELPGAGHCFPVERLDETTRHLREFFAEAEASRPPAKRAS